jgi:heat shock protein HslJ
MGLPYSWQANCVATTPYDATQPPGPKGLPEHIEINFGTGNPANQNPKDPIIYIIPKQAYIDQWKAAGNDTIAKNMSLLEDMVLQKGAGMKSSGMPVLPMERVTGTNDMAVQGKYLELGNWSGIRFVGRFSQGPNPVTNLNPQLYYMFQGFAGTQNKYFVAFFYPVITPFLPMDASQVSAAEMQRVNTDPTAYMQERIAYLNTLPDTAWNPYLSTLDAVVNSIEYTGATTAQPVPTVVPATPAPQGPYGVVIAPAGVNVRTGPDTAYPVVGVAPFNTQGAISGKSADGQWWVTPLQGNVQGWVSADYVKTYNTNGVPVVQAPPPPPPPTATPIPTAAPVPVPQIGFWADQTTINQGQCTTLRWQVDGVQAVWVYPEGANYKDYPVTGEGSRQVCPPATTTYYMRVQVTPDNVQVTQLTITVLPGNPLANTNWQLVSVYGAPVSTAGPIPTLYFSSANTVSGSGGCNQLSGPYTVNGSSLVIGPLATTQMMCDQAVMTQEQTYIQALSAVAAYEISGNQLILRTGAGQEVLRFNRIG